MSNTSNFTRHKFLVFVFNLFFKKYKINVNIPNFCPPVYLTVYDSSLHCKCTPPYKQPGNTSNALMVSLWNISGLISPRGNQNITNKF